jgi:hypothetical protein
MALRRFGVSFRARALPPLSPPNRPRATAAGFFFIFAMGDNSHKAEAVESRNSNMPTQQMPCWNVVTEPGSHGRSLLPRLSRDVW